MNGGNGRPLLYTSVSFWCDETGLFIYLKYDPVPVSFAGSNLADSLLQTADPSEAIAMAISGAELTLAEQERLREEEAHARHQWTQKARAKQIFNEAAAQMEAKGMLALCRARESMLQSQRTLSL